jgi:hypothetical protein
VATGWREDLKHRTSELPPGSVRGRPEANVYVRLCTTVVRGSMCCNYTVIRFVKLRCFHDGCCKLKVLTRGVFCLTFRAACLIEKSPEFVGMKRHRASPLGLTRGGFAFSIQTYGVNRARRVLIGLERDRRVSLSVRSLRPSRGLVLY